MTPKIVAVVGPTASGKSSLSLDLCRALGGELVSVDSMQVYRGMDIGTAKPTKEERAEIPHHLIDIRSPLENFSVNDFVTEAAAAIEGVLSRGKLPVLCGGTGLYLDTLLRGKPQEEIPAPSDELRASLFAFAEEKGNGALWEELRLVDPLSAEATHPNNVKRVVRALEIYRATGRPKSEWDRLSLLSASPYDAAVIGLRFADRETLNARMDLRIEKMLSEGLCDETKTLDGMGVFAVNKTASQAIGYKEILPVVRGEIPLSEGKERLRVATHQYGKRQMTWFSAKPYVRWINGEAEKEKLLSDALTLLARGGNENEP